MDEHLFVIGSMKGADLEQLLLFPIVQSELHPSPSTLFPSSHSSTVIALIPSPQCDKQIVGSVELLCPVLSVTYHPLKQVVHILGSVVQ
jgi:hypothetical protein